MYFQVFEIKNDAKMKRTMRRPLPSGRISPAHAAMWATSVGAAGTALLAWKVRIIYYLFTFYVHILEIYFSCSAAEVGIKLTLELNIAYIWQGSCRLMAWRLGLQLLIWFYMHLPILH